MRIDLVFSYWIFAWYLLYKAQLLNYNPKFIIIVGLIENLFLLVYMIMHGSNAHTIQWFIFINTFIKVIPFYTVRNERIQVRDIWFSGLVFGLYAVWVALNRQSLTGNYRAVVDSLIHNQDETPFLAFVKKIETTTSIK